MAHHLVEPGEEQVGFVPGGTGQLAMRLLMVFEMSARVGRLSSGERPDGSEVAMIFVELHVGC